MNFSVGITVLRQYDVLRQCLAAVHRSNLIPRRILIMDNGGLLVSEPWKDPLALVVVPPRNLGAAASWNRLIELIRPDIPIILNDDCMVDRHSFECLLRPATGSLVLGHGFACFRNDPEVFDRVGPFDESFWPAYYEDADYKARMKKMGLAWVDLGSVVTSHGNHGERPFQNFTPDEMRRFQSQLEANKLRFVAKWGGLPSDLGV